MNSKLKRGRIKEESYPEIVHQLGSLEEDVRHIVDEQYKRPNSIISIAEIKISPLISIETTIPSGQTTMKTTSAGSSQRDGSQPVNNQPSNRVPCLNIRSIASDKPQWSLCASCPSRSSTTVTNTCRFAHSSTFELQREMVGTALHTETHRK